MRRLAPFFVPILFASLVAFGETAAPAAFEADLDIARQALRDGLWDLARVHAQRLPAETAARVVLESYARENRWDKVREEMEKVPADWKSPAFRYYRAVLAGDLKTAANALREGGSLAGLAEAKMLEADLCVKDGRLDEARTLWREVVAATNVGTCAFALASVNLADTNLLSMALSKTLPTELRRTVALRLGETLLRDAATREKGEQTIRAVVAESPDVDGACEAFVALASARLSAKDFSGALEALTESCEIWPKAAKRADVQEYRGEALMGLDRAGEALEAFRRAETLADSLVARARSVLKQGDALSELGRGAEAMAAYRKVAETYAETETAALLKRVIRLRELEEKGRAAFRAYRFDEAMEAFSEVAEGDAERRERMAYYRVLCLYGLGRDDEARDAAKTLSTASPDETTRRRAIQWLAKFAYNRGDWREAIAHFSAFAHQWPRDAFAPEALLWAARAATHALDTTLAVQLVTRLAETYPQASELTAALLVQAAALVNLSRFDETLLVLDRALAAPSISHDERLRARILKADALFAMGADNAARYEAALKSYQDVRADESLDFATRLSVAFKIGRTLEKLGRTGEAMDQYYSNVVLAYRAGRARGARAGSAGEATFVRAAFRLADSFESRGLDYQAIGVLKLVVESSVGASADAAERMRRLAKKGIFK